MSASSRKAMLLGERVALRPPGGDDFRELGGLFSVDVGQGPSPAPVEAGASTYVIVGREDQRPIGVLKYQVGVPGKGWLSVDAVAVDPALRGLGLDSEAVRLLEEDVVRRGLARRFWVAVDPGDGLGLYFWLRLGYRPARPEGGVVPMIRLAAEPSASDGP